MVVGRGNLLYISQWTMAEVLGGESACRSARRLHRAGIKSEVVQLKSDARFLRSKQCRQREEDMGGEGREGGGF